MKTITVEIDDDVHRLLRQSLSVSFLAGNGSSITEQAMRKIMRAIEDGEGYVKLRRKHGS